MSSRAESDRDDSRGDPRGGRLLSLEALGQSPGAIPAIAGIAAEDMARLLTEYRSGALEGTVMNRIARGFTDDEIAAIAAHFAALR